MAQQPRRSVAPELQQTIVRQFEGGWNTINNELNLSPAYAKVMDNWWRAPDGSMQVRYGYQLVADAGLINVATNTPLLNGTIVNGTWFQGYLIVVDQTGIVAELSPANNTGIRLFDPAIAAGQTGAPASWGTTNIVNFFANAGKLIILNGNDPPLIYDHNNNPKCQYLADPATGSNYGIPKAAYGISDVGYAVLAGDALLPTTSHFSAKYTNGVYTANPNPSDAIDIDMSKITSTVDATITGLGQLRGTLVVTYKDGLSLGTLGAVGSNGRQNPIFDDQISLSGCISHRSIVSLGSDMFLCDRVGVPSLSRSNFGQLIPDRVSQLIEPDLQKNIARLSDTEIAQRIFAVFNPRERQYMLFMPKFTTTPQVLPPDPITIMAPDRPNYLAINIPNHALEEGDQFIVSGATAVGPLSAAAINSTWTVYSVIDDATVCVNTGNIISAVPSIGGGSNVTIQYTNIETLGYVFTYNPKLKIQSWARYRGMAWNWGCVDIPGRVYFGVGKKIYKYGTSESPLSADRIGDYDYTWTNNTAYNVGDLVFDVSSSTSYQCQVAHTSANTGTFVADRAARINYWTVSVGVPINFAWEWPWGDFGVRANVKSIRAVKPEAQGRAEFTMGIFVDNIYKSGLDGVRTPVRSMSFTPNEAGGFGRGTQVFGGGRRTRELRLWPIPVNCNMYKLRFEGSTTEPLRVVSVSLLYHKGGLSR